MNTDKARKILKKHNVEVIPARGINSEAVVICDGVFTIRELKAMRALVEQNIPTFSREPKKKKRKEPEYEDWMLGK